MSHWAKPGVKCVCIRTAPPEKRVAGGVYPVVGETYTIRGIVICSIGKNAGKPSLLLKEIRNPININLAAFGVNSSREVAMPIDAFRPLITKSQEDDVALFRSLLDALPVGEDA